MNEKPFEVIIFCPTGQDASLIAGVLSKAEIGSCAVSSIQELCDRNQSDAGAIVIANEALTTHNIDELNRALETQEPWSDIPILLLTKSGPKHNIFKRLQSFVASGNVTLLERPFQHFTLISAVQVALRSRRRQYQVRGLLVSEKEATRMRDEFISIASHELKTPLTSLRLQNQITQLRIEKYKEVDPEKILKYVSSTLGQIDRLNTLVDEMLDVSRIDSGKLQLLRRTFNLSELLKELIERFAPQFEGAGCEVETDISPDVIGNWDNFKIEQVINNLFSNAIRYSPGKPIKIYLGIEGEFAVMSVRDQGSGIDPLNQERIFEKFERASSAASGLGLGLFITREILDLHQGKISVESQKGQGAKFIVKLPLSV